MQGRLFLYYSPQTLGNIFPLGGRIPSFGKENNKRKERKEKKENAKEIFKKMTINNVNIFS